MHKQNAFCGSPIYITVNRDENIRADGKIYGGFHNAAGGAPLKWNTNEPFDADRTSTEIGSQLLQARMYKQDADYSYYIFMPDGKWTYTASLVASDFHHFTLFYVVDDKLIEFKHSASFHVIPTWKVNTMKKKNSEYNEEVAPSDSDHETTPPPSEACRLGPTTTIEPTTKIESSSALVSSSASSNAKASVSSLTEVDPCQLNSNHTANGLPATTNMLRCPQDAGIRNYIPVVSTGMLLNRSSPLLNPLSSFPATIQQQVSPPFRQTINRSSSSSSSSSTLNHLRHPRPCRSFLPGLQKFPSNNVALWLKDPLLPSSAFPLMAPPLLSRSFDYIPSQVSLSSTLSQVTAPNVFLPLGSVACSPLVQKQWKNKY